MGSSRNRLRRFAAPIDDNALLHSYLGKAGELGCTVTVTVGIPEGGAVSSAGISAQSLRSDDSRIDGQAIGERNTLKVDTQFNV